MSLQAFGLADWGKCFVDFLPGIDVLWTCSSKSSAEARFCFDILAAFDRWPRALALNRPGKLQIRDILCLMQEPASVHLLIFKSEDRGLRDWTHGF